MKRILFSLLIWGMCVSAFAQPEISEKWVITPVPTLKGVLGRLDINFPADVERNILIYQQADNKFLRSVSRTDKIYTIAPGQYRFTLTNVPVDNVPIQKGHETRLKAGFLDIISEGDWHLYDETKVKAYTSGNKPKKLPLPVGNYQVKLGGQFYPVIIKDGETVEDYSTVEVKDESISQQPAEIIQANIPEDLETDKYEITPVKNMKNFLGMLKINFLSDSISHKNGTMRISRNGYPDILLSGENFKTAEGLKKSNPSYPLSPDQYLIKLNNVPVKNVPIKKGHETRLKTGKLKINFINPESPYGSYQSGNAQYQFGIETRWWLLKDTMFINSVNANPGIYNIRGEGTGNITLPVGTYDLRVFGAYMDSLIVINDGETVNLEYNICMTRIICSSSSSWTLMGMNNGQIWAVKPGFNQNTYLPLPYGKYELKCYLNSILGQSIYMTLDTPTRQFSVQ